MGIVSYAGGITGAVALKHSSSVLHWILPLTQVQFEHSPTLHFSLSWYILPSCLQLGAGVGGIIWRSMLAVGSGVGNSSSGWTYISVVSGLSSGGCGVVMDPPAVWKFWWIH